MCTKTEPKMSDLISVRDNSSCSLDSRTSTQSTISLKHYDHLLAELRCPGCADPMCAPIRLCNAGHSICVKCCERSDYCPLCGDHITKIRSLNLEALAEKMFFRCQNYRRGCTSLLPKDLMAWHAKECQFNEHTCEMGKVWNNCTWRGLQMNWTEHCTTVHSDKMFDTNEQILTWKYSTITEKKAFIGFYILNCFNAIFNLYQVQNKDDSKVSWTMIQVSDRSENYGNKFVFEIEIFKPNDPRIVIVHRNVCESNCKTERISIAISELMRFFDKEKVVHYIVRIIPVDDLNVKLGFKAIESYSSEAQNEDRLIDIHSLTDTDLMYETTSLQISASYPSIYEKERIEPPRIDKPPRKPFWKQIKI